MTEPKRFKVKEFDVRCRHCGRGEFYCQKEPKLDIYALACALCSNITFFKKEPEEK